MTPLRQRMVEDMQMRNFSPHTRDAYVRAVAQLALYHKRSPDQLDTEAVRAYLLHLINERRVSPSTFNQVRCALRFFYRITLGREWALDRIVCQKEEQKLPVVLSRGEVRRLFAAARRLKSRAILNRVPATRAGLTYEAYSFRDHVLHLAQTTQGVSLVSLEPDSAFFAIGVDNEPYRVVLSWDGQVIHIGVLSRITFLPGRAPPAVAGALAGWNQRLPHFDYELIDDPDETFFCVHGQIRVGALDAPTFAAAIKDMAPAMRWLDSFLLENGYVRIA